MIVSGERNHLPFVNCLRIKDYLGDHFLINWLCHPQSSIRALLRREKKRMKPYDYHTIENMISKGKTVLCDTNISKNDLRVYLDNGFKILMCFPHDFKAFMERYDG